MVVAAAAAAEPAVWGPKEAEPLRPAVAMKTASLQTLVAVSPHHLCLSLQSSFYSCSVKYEICIYYISIYRINVLISLYYVHIFFSHLSSLLFLFPLLFILQAFLLLARDDFCEAIVVGAGLQVLRRGNLRVVVNDDNTYSKTHPVSNVTRTVVTRNEF